MKIFWEYIWQILSPNFFVIAKTYIEMNIDISEIEIRYFSLKQIAVQSSPDVERKMAVKLLLELFQRRNET